uniref:Uncharacterized protein n=1 Tax=Podarcis muralis TaxID=64176 RepID=A0A670KK66_PODMU
MAQCPIPILTWEMRVRIPAASVNSLGDLGPWAERARARKPIFFCLGPHSPVDNILRAVGKGVCVEILQQI